VKKVTRERRKLSNKKIRSLHYLPQISRVKGREQLRDLDVDGRIMDIRECRLDLTV
jgi:hypothetical protein